MWCITDLCRAIMAPVTVVHLRLPLQTSPQTPTAGDSRHSTMKGREKTDLQGALAAGRRYLLLYCIAHATGEE